MAHNSTTFAQPLKLVPRDKFERLAAEHRSGRSPQWCGLQECQSLTGNAGVALLGAGG